MISNWNVEMAYHCVNRVVSFITVVLVLIRTQSRWADDRDMSPVNQSKTTRLSFLTVEQDRLIILIKFSVGPHHIVRQMVMEELCHSLNGSAHRRFRHAMGVGDVQVKGPSCQVPECYAELKKIIIKLTIVGTFEYIIKIGIEQ